MAEPGRTPQRVAAVVVTFHPDAAAVGELLHALAPQVDDLVVVDNGSGPAEVEHLAAVVAQVGATLLPLPTNLGIAGAQNAGVRRARDHGAELVLLSDQDSLPAADMVPRLVDGLRRARDLARRGTAAPVAAVGPVTTDERNSDAPLLFSDHRWGPRRATVPRQDGALVEVTFLIASGCLVDVAALDAVGEMNEAWFIDHVDLEWGLRARRAGYALYGVVGARLGHALGDRTQRIPGRGRDVHIHSPLRNYYMARNTVLLIRSGLLSSWWRWGYAAWITKYGVFYALAVRPRGSRARLVVRGLRDGLRGVTGPLPDGAAPR